MNGLYGRLASINIRNNHRFYLPYLLTGGLSVAMFYLVMSLQSNPGLGTMHGGAEIWFLLGLGVIIVGVFVSIFLFYTNSFIIKRRKKEFGVYNILGMEKKHIAKVLFLETLFTAAVSIGCGLAFGIVFHKFLAMLLYYLTRLETSVPFTVSTAACVNTVKLFLAIYAAAFLCNLMQIKLANPIELLHGSNAGEREPKTKLLMTLAGIVTLGAGYYIALTIRDAVSAILMFFVAVLLVIAGTYFLFTAGSIAFLKLLRKNQRYYYQAKHFTTVSGMLYRMKQNAVGLANICILSTMVLVTVSTTVAMYAGMEDSLYRMYPEEIAVTTYFSELPAQKDLLSSVVAESLRSSGRTVTVQSGGLSLEITALRGEDSVSAEGIGAGTEYNVNDVALLVILTADDYESITGDVLKEAPSAGEVVVAADPLYEADTVRVGDVEYAVRESRPAPEESRDAVVSLMSGTFYLIVPDEQTLVSLRETITDGWSLERVKPMYQYEMCFEIDGTGEEKMAAEERLEAAVHGWEDANAEGTAGYQYSRVIGREQSRSSLYSLYGGMFFLGMFLGVLFLMVTVLIIFYKQISEGYEDKERYAIMEKVGMSNGEVRRAIRSQILTVFFLPIVAAVIHVAMAFPMITLMLEALSLTNVKLFALCVCGTALVFGMFYLAVFLLTSRSYYRIVGNQV